MAKRKNWKPDPGVGQRDKCDCSRCRQLREDWPLYYIGNASFTRERARWIIKRRLKRWRIQWKKREQLRARRARWKKQKREPMYLTRERMDAALASIRAKIIGDRWRLSFECFLELETPPDFDERRRKGSVIFATRDDESSLATPTESEALNDEGLSIREKGKHGYFAPLLAGSCDGLEAFPGCEGLRPAKRRYCLHCETKVHRALVKAKWTPLLIEEFLTAPVAGKDRFVSPRKEAENDTQPAADSEVTSKKTGQAALAV